LLAKTKQPTHTPHTLPAKNSTRLNRKQHQPITTLNSQPLPQPANNTNHKKQQPDRKTNHSIEGNPATAGAAAKTPTTHPKQTK
jgi:hypothetical protein